MSQILKPVGNSELRIGVEGQALKVTEKFHRGDKFEMIFDGWLGRSQSDKNGVEVENFRHCVHKLFSEMHGSMGESSKKLKISLEKTLSKDCERSRMLY